MLYTSNEIEKDMKRVLIVDDDQDDTSLFSEALNDVDPGSVCYCATDGLEAIEKLDSSEIQHPDIIFLDLNMPGMNGWECLSKLKSTEHYRNIPVIIHTTSARKDDRELARELGAICFVTKSYDFKQIKQMLQIVLEKLRLNAPGSICETVYKRLGLIWQ